MSGAADQRGRPTEPGETAALPAETQPEPEPAAQGQHRRSRPPRLPRVREFTRESLFKNSAALLINLVMGACCGYGALILLTRLYSVQAVGLSATALAASALVVSSMAFGVNYSLPRFLPNSAHRVALINTALTAITLCTMLAAIVFLALPVADKLFALGGWIFAVVFVAGTGFQAAESVLGIVLIADRSSGKVARANILPNAVKLGAPAAFVAIGSLGAYLARIINDVVATVILARTVGRRGHRFRPALSVTATRELSRFSLGMYVATLVGGLPQMLLPIIVLARFGARQAAYWSIAITIAYLVYQLDGTVAQALIPEVASRPSERRHLLLRAAVMIVAVMLPALILAYVLAPFGLKLFGPIYVAGSLVPLHILIIAGFITILNYVTGSILVLAKKTSAITIVNIFNAIIVLGLTAVWATGSRDVAIAWAVGDVENTLLLGFFAVMALRAVRGRWELLGDDPAPAPKAAS